MRRLLPAIVAFLIPGLIQAADKGLTVEDCVAAALKQSGTVKQASAKVDQYRAQLAQVQSFGYPKIIATGIVAPMFTVEGSALTENVERDFALDKWGPYTRLEATLALPIYTFGRLEAGKLAASERVAVEEAQVRVAASSVALEVHKFYYLYLYTKTIQPTLQNAIGIVTGAIETAQDRYNAGDGSVTKVDLMRLEYALTEVQRYMREAADGEALALAALKHTMGVPDDQSITIAANKLPRLPKEKLPTLTDVLKLGANERPEWAQVRHGLAAATALRRAEEKGYYPIVALAGQFAAAWTPTRDDSLNPYHRDPYNEVFGGAGLALLWQFDPAMTMAKVQGAEALKREVQAIKVFADSGIPLQIRRAHQEVVRARDVTKLSKKAVKATRKWMTFGAAAFSTGTGEPKDFLEGLAAYVLSQNNYYTQLQTYWAKAAELKHSTGTLVPAS